jgi:hypothetical protein
MFDNNNTNTNLLIVSTLLGIILSKILNIDNIIYTLLLICGIYIIVLCIFNNKDTFTNVFNNINMKTKNNNNKYISTLEDYNNNIKNNEANTLEVKNLNDNNNNNNNNSSYWPKKTKKNKSPFEGLLPQQLKNRLNYLYYATSHPFKAKSYTNYLHSNSCAPKSIKHLDVARQYYPQLTQDQVNYDDCLNFPNGHPNSCNQGNDKWEAESKILGKQNNDEINLKQILIEDSNQKKIVTNIKNPFHI